MSPRKTSTDTRSTTSSQASAAGLSPSSSPGGRLISRYGQVPAHASLSAMQAKKQGLLMSGISGPPLNGSSASDSLNEFLVSRLQARTRTLGSTLYKLTWKPWVTPSGRSRSRLRASVLLKSGTARTGWPTPTTRDHKDGFYCPNVPLNALLGRVAWMAGWPTPLGSDSVKRGEVKPRKDGAAGALPETAALAGWPTPVATDEKWRYSTTSAAERRLASGKQMSLEAWALLTGPVRLTVTGEMLTGSAVRTESGGQLNPEHSRWLMAYPSVWCVCAVTATQ